MMASSIKKKKSSKQSKVNDPRTMTQESCVTTRLQGSEEDGSQDVYINEMSPDKEVEGKALQICFTYLSENLPPDDVAMEMNSRELLTRTEHDKYLSMKQAHHISDITKSEYLLQCLGRRKAGFLTQLSEILREIKQASYLVDAITKAYKTANQQLVSNSRLGARDRLSKLSLSDPDLYAKGAQECARCKILEQRNTTLEKRCRQLKDQQELCQSPFPATRYLIQKQVDRIRKEGEDFHQLISMLQTGIAQMANKSSALQTNLQVLTDMSTPDQDWSTAIERSARESTISEQNMHRCTEEVRSKVNKEQSQNHRTGHRMVSATKSYQQNQPLDGHQIDMTQTESHQQRNRTQSYSVTQQVMVSDPELQSALQRRLEKMEAAANNHAKRN